jgi:endonuclease/exonuclease/phosphatase family metal-dependent hydrolase
MNNFLHFVSVNIERDKHLDKILPFLKNENADVVCLQEVFERDIPRFEKELGMSAHFSVMMRMPYPAKNPKEILSEGVAILTKLPVVKIIPHYYKNSPLHLPVYKKYIEGEEDSMAAVLLCVVVSVRGEDFTLATTHFTWTPHGEADDRQRRDLKELLKITESFKNGIVFAGDFNAPRGREIFDELAKKYKDNIPPEYETSLDVTLHRAPDEVKHLMVDGLFSTPEYSVNNAKLHFGVSDHAAIVANIEKIT